MTRSAIDAGAALLRVPPLDNVWAVTLDCTLNCHQPARIRATISETATGKTFFHFSVTRPSLARRLRRQHVSDASSKLFFVLRLVAQVSDGCHIQRCSATTNEDAPRTQVIRVCCR